MPPVAERGVAPSARRQPGQIVDGHALQQRQRVRALDVDHRLVVDVEHTDGRAGGDVLGFDRSIVGRARETVAVDEGRAERRLQVIERGVPGEAHVRLP